MRKLLGACAVVLGAAGVLVCAAAVGVGWRVALRTVDRVDRVAAVLDHGLSEADERLARVESRVTAVRSEINEVRGAAAAVAGENPELPRVQARIKQLLDRLGPALDRANATADSLRAVAAGLRTAADLAQQFDDDHELIARVRTAADAIDRGAAALNAPQAKIDAVNSAGAVQLTRRLVDLAREAVAGSELLADGLAAAREEIAAARRRAAEYRDIVVFRVYAAAAVNTLLWLWAALGQLCLIGWGRRRISGRGPATH